MPEFLEHHPGLLYVVATLLPLASFLILLLVGGVRCFVRKSPEGSFGETVYKALGGDTPGRIGAYVATGAIGLAFVCSLAGAVLFFSDHAAHTSHAVKADKHGDKHREEDAKHGHGHAASKWSGRLDWAGIGRQDNVKQPGTVLQLGYHIDHLSVIMFLMVTFIATLIHVFSIGYMADELQRTVTDHDVHTAHGHLHRRGRFGQFFLFLSLFCFSMLNLILADNLFQVFVSWELVGICSYLLIGFYFERQSASNAANKAFITNRVGDAGFIIGLLIIWTSVGTFNFEEIFARVRAPVTDFHGEPMELAGRIVRGNPTADGKKLTLAPASGSDVVLFPVKSHLHAENWTALDRDERDRSVPREVSTTRAGFGTMPYWLLVAAGLGIFLGCVGKSAQFPLHVWLPDAMEGPTPVSALIHAATMVAAGVYLVGRTFPLFTAEALLVIAYTGAITLFVAATIALVMTDIKKVLAYSTVSQLGYMMLGLGVGGWAAGLFHLITHAFFKALLFLGSGSIIYGCHHQQEMTKMGGLYRKMKITALTMLVGCLAIAGTPLFSGWYSKDSILAHAWGFGMVHSDHILLFILPLLTATITTFYMFRMWFMTFTGKPRDHHVYDNAHESPYTMTVPLIILAVCALAVAWGWPVFDPEASLLEGHIHHGQPTSVIADFGGVAGLEVWSGPRTAFQESPQNVRFQAHKGHALAGFLALGMALLGFLFAYLVYYRGVLDPADAKEQFPGLFNFLRHKWYFDELYSALFVRPAMAVASWCRGFDTRVIDGVVDGTAKATVGAARGSGRFDLGIIDGLANLTARVFYGIGAWLRNVQTGYLRSYVIFLVVAAVGIWVLLIALLGQPPAR